MSKTLGLGIPCEVKNVIGVIPRRSDLIRLLLMVSSKSVDRSTRDRLCKYFLVRKIIVDTDIKIVIIYRNGSGRHAQGDPRSGGFSAYSQVKREIALYSQHNGPVKTLGLKVGLGPIVSLHLRVTAYIREYLDHKKD